MSKLVYNFIFIIVSNYTVYAANTGINNYYISENSILNNQDIQSARELIAEKFIKAMQEKMAEVEQDKFTAGLGCSSSKFKTKNDMNLKGSSFAEFILLGYQITPELSVIGTLIQNKISSRSNTVPFKSKGVGNIFTPVINYKLLKWLNIDFSLTKNNEKNKNISHNSPNVISVLHTSYTIPKFSLKMTVPLSQQIITMPDIGVSRSYINTKSYIDNNMVTQPRKKLTMDQLSINAKIAYMVSLYAIPYIIAGYDRVTRYKLPLKSKNTFKGGLGSMLMGGVINFDWTLSKAYKTTTVNTFNLSFFMKF